MPALVNITCYTREWGAMGFFQHASPKSAKLPLLSLVVVFLLAVGRSFIYTAGIVITDVYIAFLVFDKVYRAAQDATIVL